MLTILIDYWLVFASLCIFCVFTLLYSLYSLVLLIFRVMDPDEAKYMRTERKPGTLDVHQHLNALVLNYEIDVQILGNRENVIYREKKNLKKIIELPNLNSRTDCLALAKEVAFQCDLIHHSRIPEVEQTIYYLKKRKLTHGAIKESSSIDLLNKSVSDEPNYNNLPDYIELLYEGMSEKIRGAHQIQLLARDPDNLEALSKNETVISALGRVLREDWKKSIVLSTHLVFTFFCFSMYTRFHEVILKCKVGSICMDIIDYELRRYAKWKADLEGVEAPSDVSLVRKNNCPNSASMSEIREVTHRSRIPEPVRPRSGNFTMATAENSPNGKQTMEGSVYDDLTNSTENIDDDHRKLSQAEKAKRFRTLVKKQEHLLRVAFYLLLNIAEDESIEEKMTKRNIVGLLMKALEDRENEELLVLVVTFLKKLSIMQCNKENMMGMNVAEMLPKQLDSNNADLVHLTLKLLFNLSFDEKARAKMVRVGLLPRLMALLSDDRHQEIVLKLLYHLSYEDDVKQLFTEYVGLITDMLLLNVGNDGDEVMVALCVNLATEQSNAQQILKKNRLQPLMVRAFTHRNATLMKLLRNLAEHDTSRSHFIEFVGDLAKAVVETRSQDHQCFIIECVGILSNLNLPELDWAEIFKHFDLLKYIAKIISSNNSEPELVLQVVILLGTAAEDEGCAQYLCDHKVMEMLIELLKTHQEDDEIVVQIIYVFFAAISHEELVDFVAEKTEAPAYLIDLLQDNSKAVRQLCNDCLNIIAGHNQVWGERIRIEKFRHHNAQWLQMLDSQQLERVEHEEEEESEQLPPYLNTEYLSTAVVPPLSDETDEGESGTAHEDDLGLISQRQIDSDYFEKSPEATSDFEIEAI